VSCSVSETRRIRNTGFNRSWRAGYSRSAFFQLPIDPKLDPPDGKQIELGFGLARDHPVADMELPFPDARSERRDGEFNALVDHMTNPATAPAA
jgi:hypothetical protein